MACNGLKVGTLICLGTPERSFLEKLFLTHLTQNSPFSRHNGIFGGPKGATTGSKRAKNTCFGIPCGLGSFLKKAIFLHPVGLVDPFWHPPFGLLAACSGPRYGGRGVHLSNSEGLETTKSGWLRVD